MDGVADFASQGVKERLLAGGGPSLDRMPLLREVFEEMAADLQNSLRGVADGAMQFIVEAVTVARASDVVAEAEAAALAVAYVGDADLDAKTVLCVDRRFVFVMLEGLFGADGSEAPIIPERELTAVEIRVGMLTLGRVTKALQSAFSSVACVNLPLEPAEKSSEPPGGGRKGHAAVCRCRLRAFGVEGELLVAIPQATLDPLRDALSQEAPSATSSSDPLWAKQMKERVTQTEVTLSAVIEKADLTLGDVARLEVGQIIELPVSPTGLVALVCEGQSLFWCEIGQKDGAYTIRIDDFVDQRQEFIDDVLRG